VRSEAKLSHRLAEDGEGVSEARPGGEAKEIRPRRYVVDSKTETRRPKVGAGVGSVGRSFRQEASSHIPEWVEISEARVAGSINRGSVSS